MSENLLLSIIIPTKNRPFSLLHSVRSAVSIVENLPGEVILVSNGKSLESDISELDDELRSKCKIVRSANRLSLSQNWAFGFTRGTGKWITLLGDDDIIAFNDKTRLRHLLEHTLENGIKFRSGSFKWSLDGQYQEHSFSSPRINHKVRRLKTPSNLVEWWKLEPREYPSGAGVSFLRKTWVEELDSRGILFTALSPDWFTASLYVYTFENYLAVDEVWAYLGDHPASSIAQMKNPSGELAQQELGLNPYLPHVSLNLKQVRYPTTWLARMDSILRAREICGLSVNVQERQLIKSALRTTPRYIMKVRRSLFEQYPSHGFTINLVAINFLWGSIMRTLMLKLRSKFRVKPSNMHMY
jgi:hypothetical protein